MKRNTLFLTLCAVMLFATGVSAQTTGTIDGAIVDENMASLPGVTVEATSPNLQGTKVAVADNGGKFHLVFMPPGVYTVRFTLQGFTTVEQTGIVVELGRVVVLNVQMRSAFKEEVVVSGATPILDTKSTELGVNFTADQFARLPTARNYAGVVLTAAGTQNTASGDCPDCISIYGSTGAENAYFIDGVNTTGIELATQGKQLNFEFIQEVQVKTGSYQAEFGRSTGGVLNVITKSGGNEYHGDVFAYYDNQQSSIKSSNLDLSRATQTYVIPDFTRKDYGLDIGGYFVQDKLWFFAAYDRVNNDSDIQIMQDWTVFGGPTADTIYSQKIKRDLWSGKLTWRVAQNHSFIVSGFGDPTNTGGPLIPTYALAGEESTFLGTVDEGGTDYTAKYEGVFAQNLVATAQYAKHEETYDPSTSPGFTKVLVIDRTHTVGGGTFPVSGGFGFAQLQEFGREVWRGDIAYFLNNFGGDHEFKIGAEVEKIDVLSNQYDTGTQRIRIRCKTGTQITGADGELAGCEPGGTYYEHEFYMTSRPSDVLDPSMGDYVADGYPVTSGGDNFSYFVQDNWRLTSALTLNLGVRLDQQKFYTSSGATAAYIKDNWAPRVGFIWDATGRGMSKVYASWGRFYETIPMDMVIRSFGGEITALTYNRTGNASNVVCQPEEGFRSCRIVGKETTPIDPDTGGQYVDEIVVGGEFEVVKDLVVGGKYIYRNLGRVIEDSLGSDQGYYLGNPGEGLLSGMWDESYTYLFPAPKPERKFTGVEVVAKKRFSNNWQMTASYLWSRLEGNYDGTFQASTGQLDPNLNSAFDYAEFSIQNNGLLSFDRTHMFKFNALYEFNFGLSAGVSAYYMTGTPITAYGYDVTYRNYEYYLSKRGAYGRTDAEYEMDLHLGYPIKLGGLDLNLLLDVFNLLDRQGETGRDMRFNLDQTIDVIDDATGEVAPLLPGGTQCTGSGCNPNFNKSNTFQNPRAIRLGVRLTF
jgi:outer membrane receptor protein involved in Fe transport